MKQSITFSQFTDAFRNMGRKDNFSHNGLRALFEYLIQYEEDTGTEIELDVIGLCCDYSEYENLSEFQDDYNANDYKAIDNITEVTQVIDIPESDGFIIQQF